jgi:tetratricopeptide (TPR) repeat protein
MLNLFTCDFLCYPKDKFAPMNLNYKIHRREESLVEYYEKALKKKLNKALSENNFTQLLILSNELIEIDSSEAFYYYTRGLAKYQLNNLADAFIDFTACINMKPNEFPDAYYYRGICKFNMNDFQKAAKLNCGPAIIFIQEYSKN